MPLSPFLLRRNLRWGLLVLAASTVCPGLRSLFAVVEKTENKRRQTDDLYGDSWDVGPDGHWKPPPVSEGGPTARLAEVPRSYEAFYETADDAMRAQDELDGLTLRGVSVRVTWPKEKFARKEPGMVNVQGVIGGVPDEEVKEFLTQTGKVRSLRRYKDIRFGEVLFKNEDDAWNAKVELEGTTLLGKILRLELDCSTNKLDKVLVHGLSFCTTWQDLKDHFLPMGDISFCTIHGASRTARLSFPDAKSAASAVKELSRSSIEGFSNEIKVTYPYHRAQTEVRVSCLDKDVTEDQLRMHFEKAGPVDVVEFIAEELPPEFKERRIQS